jgi:restriction endonuclease S subunit
MARGRKPLNSNTINTWEDIFWKNIPTYINILNNYLSSNGFELIEVGNTIEKNIFKIPKGLNSKDIKQSGVYPVISQSKEFIIGFSDNADLLVKDNFPLIVFGDHSKTIKYVKKPFVIGADGVKILKPKSNYNEKFFYYFLHGVITDTKDYGRHYSLLRKGSIANVKDIVFQESIVGFLDNLKDNSISYNHIFFNQDIENEIFSLQISQFKQLDISSALNHQLNLMKQLRQAFLREAMQGKLIKSINAKETGQQLLAKIKAEKANLIAEKKLKKEKELTPITVDEIPFEIPEHWVWCRLGEICTKIGSGSTPKGSNYAEIGKPFFRSQNVHDNGLVYEDIKFVSDVVQKQMNGTIVLSSDILLNITGGSMGRCALVPNDFEEGNVSQHVCIIRPLLLDNIFLHKLVLSPYFQKLIFSSTTGAGREGLPKYNLEQFIIPLPPLHEQEKIVAKLEELMAFCDGLEQSVKDSQAYNEKLLQQVLRESLQPKKEVF